MGWGYIAKRGSSVGFVASACVVGGVYPMNFGTLYDMWVWTPVGVKLAHEQDPSGVGCDNINFCFLEGNDHVKWNRTISGARKIGDGAVFFF